MTEKGPPLATKVIATAGTHARLQEQYAEAVKDLGLIVVIGHVAIVCCV